MRENPGAHVGWRDDSCISGYKGHSQCTYIPAAMPQQSHQGGLGVRMYPYKRRRLRLYCFFISLSSFIKLDDFLTCLIIRRKMETGQKSCKIARKQKNRPEKLQKCNFSGRQAVSFMRDFPDVGQQSCGRIVEFSPHPALKQCCRACRCRSGYGWRAGSFSLLA